MAGGKRKILMKRRETKEQRAVSFSKRRRGLLNKAAEYCLRTRNSQVAMVVSSPVSDKTFYAFGHSSVDSVFDAFINNRVPEATDNENIIVRLGVLMFNKIKDLELEKKAKKRDYEREGFWKDYEKLGNFESIGELQVIVDKLLKAREKAIIRMNELLFPQVSASGSCRASASDVIGYDCDHNKEFIKFGSGYVKQDVMAGLECDAQQGYFGNFLSMIPSMCPFISNSADKNIGQQNCLASAGDQLNIPIASAKEFWGSFF